MRKPLRLCLLLLGLTLSGLAALSEPVTGLRLNPRSAAAAPLLPCPPPPATPGVPLPFPCEPDAGAERDGPDPVEPEDMCLRLHTEPSGAVEPGQTVRYELSLTNHGPGRVRHLALTVPFAPEQQELLDVHFSDRRGWVSAVLTDSVAIRVESLGGDEQITATLHLRTMPDVQLEAPLVTQAALEWAATGPGAPVRSNQVALVVSELPNAGGARPLTIAADPADPAAVEVLFDGFAPGELVSLWYHRPEGTVVGLEAVAADEQGALTARIRPASPVAGTYWLVAHGQCSTVTAAGPVSFPGRLAPLVRPDGVPRV